MAVVVRMPAPLAGVTEGAIASWLATEGQTVAVGEPLAEIETEKAVVEYQSEVAGTVGRLLAQPGDNLPVGAPIAVILAEGEGDDAIGPALAAAGVDADASDPAAAPAQPPVPEPATEPVPEPAAAPSDEPAAAAAPEPPPSAEPEAGFPPSVRDASSTPPGPPAAQSASAQSAGARSAGAQSDDADAAADDTSRRFASPLVRRLAKERGIDLVQLQGTGPSGRIVRRDLEAYEPPATSADAAGQPAASSRPAELAEPAGADRTAAGYTDVPLTGMRRAIARRLTESKTTVPHFYLSADCTVDALLELRRQANAGSARKISVNDFVLKAVAAALVRVPAANAIWNGDSIRRFDGVDLAVAVAIDDGLLTPVVRGVDMLTLSQVAAEVSGLAERARAGRLRQHELEGGSFSVSNLGMYGVDAFSAILNPPQAGILAVGAAKPRPVVVDGQLAVGTVMTVTLSADHRVLDGAVAAEWMAAFVELIENPVSILV